MERALDTTQGSTDVTRRLAELASGMTFEKLPATAVEVAKQCLLDWLGVTLAGAQEPLVQKLLDFAAADGLGDKTTLIGLNARGTASQAALINGSAGHALDYDDCLRALKGHPTAPVAPVVFAVAERDGISGKDLLTAFVAGVEAEARVGMLMGDGHYLNGWHSTATNGTYGAAAAAARLLGLDGAATSTAFGIAGTQAAGLKASFGTMCKPLHAGKAAMNGLLAAELAARGFTGRDDILECNQGYGFTQTDSYDEAAALDDLDSHFWTPNVLFKYHAACYGTHAGIESAGAIRQHPAFDLAKIERIDVTAPSRTMNMCNIPEPTTGLEVKFSHRHTTAMALTGEPTGDPALYDEKTASRPDLVALRGKVTVGGDDTVGPNETHLTVHLSDGTVIREQRDMAIPNTDLKDQWNKLESKFRALATPLIGEANTERAITIVGELETREGIQDLLEACAKRV